MDRDETFENFEDRASRGIREVKSEQNRVKEIESKDLVLEYQEQTRSFIARWCIFLLTVLVFTITVRISMTWRGAWAHGRADRGRGATISALTAAFADSTNQTFFKDNVLERTLKVAGLILPIITLALGFYFGSPGRR